MEKLELVSFPLCPYVQRSVITLKHKKAPFDITYIDLEKPPEWFLKISPLGKVPVLKVNDSTVLFESAVINEYLDETVGEPMLSRDPLKRAFQRAWIAFGSELSMSHYQMTFEEDAERLPEMKKEFFDDLARVEAVLSVEGPYFSGKELSLVDAAWAPLFMRLYLSEQLRTDQAWKNTPRTRKWADHLVAEQVVKESVPADFADAYVAYCRNHGSKLY